VRERLDEVVIGTGIEARDTVGDGIARGQHQDRHTGPRAQPPADLDAVESRQHHVQHHEVGRLIARGGEREGTVRRDVHRVTLVRERAPERRRETGIIVDHEDPPPCAHPKDDGAGVIVVPGE
jgi:hypothetical protein